MMCPLACCVGINNESTCTMTNLMEMVKIAVLTFQLSFFCVSIYTSLLPIPFLVTFHSDTIKSLWPFSFLLKPSSSSPLQNHHHLWQGTLEKILFWHKISSFLKVTSFLFVFHSVLFGFSLFFASVFCWFSFSFWTCLIYAFWLCNDLWTSNVRLMTWWFCNVLFWLCNNLWTSNVWFMMVFSTIKVSAFLLFTLFCKYMHQGSHWFMLW